MVGKGGEGLVQLGGSSLPDAGEGWTPLAPTPRDDRSHSQKLVAATRPQTCDSRRIFVRVKFTNLAVSGLTSTQIS